MPAIVFEDDFENNNFDLWTGAGVVWSTTDAQKKTGTYSAYGLGAAADRNLYKTLPDALARARITFYVRASELVGTHYVISSPGYALMMTGGHFQYHDGTYHNLPVDTTFIANQWYKVEMEFVAATNSIKWWIDDAYKGEATSLAFDSYYQLFFVTASVVGRNMWIDDVVVEDITVEIVCTADAQSTASAATKVARKITITSDGQATAEVSTSVLRKVSGGADATSTASAAVKVLRKIGGGADGQSTTSATVSIIVFIAATADAQSTALATVTVRVFIIGTADAQSGADATVKVLRKIICTADAQSTASMAIGVFVFIVCAADAQSLATIKVIVTYAEITPAMHKDLIEPYGDMGAWLWLAEIVVPTQVTQRIARNSAPVVYGVTSFAAGNFEPGRIPLAGDGSVPRIQLQVTQDGTGTLEAIVNATKGGENGTVKLIRTCEKYFDSPVKALERTYDILTAGSDPQWVSFILGIPSVLTQRIPLWSYSSKVCPLATPSLFKGPRCQYTLGDETCTGLFEDCRTKGNEIHWGAEIGLDPSAVRV